VQIVALDQTRHLHPFSRSVRKNETFYGSKSDNCSVFRSVVFYTLSEDRMRRKFSAENLTDFFLEKIFTSQKRKEEEEKKFLA
jgi:hypothetical protein